VQQIRCQENGLQKKDKKEKARQMIFQRPKKKVLQSQPKGGGG
jgi:hypothetical protein